MKCAPAARRTALPDLPSPDFSLNFSGCFDTTAPPLPVKPRPGEKELSSPNSTQSARTPPWPCHRTLLKNLSVQRDARLVVPAPTIIEGLVGRLILVVGIGRRLAAWRVRPEAQVLQYPPDPLGFVDKTDDVYLSAAPGTGQRIDFPDLLDHSRQVGDGILRELSIPISISSTTCFDEPVISFCCCCARLPRCRFEIHPQ